MRHLNTFLFRDCFAPLSVEKHGESDVSLQHRGIESDLHRPVVEAVGRVGNVLLVDVEIFIVVDDDRRTIVDRLEGDNTVYLIKAEGIPP